MWNTSISYSTYSYWPLGCRLVVRRSWWMSSPRWCDSYTLALRALEWWEILLPLLVLLWSTGNHPQSGGADLCEDRLLAGTSSPYQHSRTCIIKGIIIIMKHWFLRKWLIYPQSIEEILEPWGMPSVCLKYLKPSYWHTVIKIKYDILTTTHRSHVYTLTKFPKRCFFKRSFRESLFTTGYMIWNQLNY